MNDKILYLDTETTGLSSNDELLQVSIIDDQNNVVFNSYIKPIFHNEWVEAEKIHHITPSMVADAPTKEQVSEELFLLLKGNTVVIYNAEFDSMFLEYELSQSTVICAMKLYSKTFNEWSDYWKDYKWSKLGDALWSANFEEYKELSKNFHDALTDCKACKFVFDYTLSKIGEDIYENRKNEDIIKYEKASTLFFDNWLANNGHQIYVAIKPATKSFYTKWILGDKPKINKTTFNILFATYYKNGEFILSRTKLVGNTLECDYGYYLFNAKKVAKFKENLLQIGFKEVFGKCVIEVNPTAYAQFKKILLLESTETAYEYFIGNYGNIFENPLALEQAKRYKKT